MNMQTYSFGSFLAEQSGQARINSPPSIMRGLSALRAERGQLSLTSSFYASAHPAGGFYIMGKCGAVSYDINKNTAFCMTVILSAK